MKHSLNRYIRKGICILSDDQHAYIMVYEMSKVNIGQIVIPTIPAEPGEDPIYGAGSDEYKVDIYTAPVKGQIYKLPGFYTVDRPYGYDKYKKKWLVNSTLGGYGQQVKYPTVKVPVYVLKHISGLTFPIVSSRLTVYTGNHSGNEAISNVRVSNRQMCVSFDEYDTYEKSKTDNRYVIWVRGYGFVIDSTKSLTEYGDPFGFNTTRELKYNLTCALPTGNTMVLDLYPLKDHEQTISQMNNTEAVRMELDPAYHTSIQHIGVRMRKDSSGLFADVQLEDTVYKTKLYYCLNSKNTKFTLFSFTDHKHNYYMPYGNFRDKTTNTYPLVVFSTTPYPYNMYAYNTCFFATDVYKVFSPYHGENTGQGEVSNLILYADPRVPTVVDDSVVSRDTQITACQLNKGALVWLERDEWHIKPGYGPVVINFTVDNENRLFINTYNKHLVINNYFGDLRFKIHDLKENQYSMNYVSARSVDVLLN